MKRLADRLVYSLVRTLDVALARLPVPWVWQLGAVLGGIAHRLLPGYRRLARESHRRALGEEMSEPAIRRSVARMFRYLGGDLLGGLRLARASEAEIRDRVVIEGLENFRNPVKEGRGNVIALLHMGAWEALAQLKENFQLPGQRIATIYQPLGNPYLDDYVRATRERRGIETISRADGFCEAVRILRSNGVVGILIDQHAGDAGLWTPFFGRLASTTTLPALLARRTGAPLQIASVITEAPGRWRMRVRTVCDQPSGRSVEELTALLNRAAEKEIRQAPHQWFWVHRRWKTPSPQFLLRRYRRGMYHPDPTVPLKPFRVVVRSPNWLGDAVMSVPAVRALRHGRPDLLLTLLTPAKLADLWRAVPEVDAVLPFDPKDTVFTTARRLRRAGPFDAAIVLPNSVRSALEPWLAGIPRRVGYAGRWRQGLLNQIVPEPRRPGPPQHQSRRYLDLALRIGADSRDAAFALAPSQPPAETHRIAVCPGAEYGPAKRWPPERFAEVIRTVSARRACHWTIVGTAKDAAIAHTIAAQAGTEIRDLTGKTTLAALMNELQSCRLLLTNDTGTMHLAALLGTPVVALFGSTEPALTGPMGAGHTVLRHRAECSPCFLRKCPLDFRCMQAILPDEAVEAVLRILDATEPQTVRTA